MVEAMNSYQISPSSGVSSLTAEGAASREGSSLSYRARYNE